MTLPISTCCERVLLSVLIRYDLRESVVIYLHFVQEKELVQLKREARLKGGFYVSPEAKLLFVVRIRGYGSVSSLCRFSCNAQVLIVVKCDV